MKALILVLLLLIPVVYAQDNMLEGRKASLDLRASEFIIRMNAAIDFANKCAIELVTSWRLHLVGDLDNGGARDIREALVGLVADLVARQVPVALALQERIRQMR